jgi:hypothetical protein
LFLPYHFSYAQGFAFSRRRPRRRRPAQTPSPDPGVRGGITAAGGPIGGLNGLEIAYFNAAQARFAETDSMLGTAGGGSAEHDDNAGAPGLPIHRMRRLPHDPVYDRASLDRGTVESEFPKVSFSP